MRTMAVRLGQGNTLLPPQYTQFPSAEASTPVEQLREAILLEPGIAGFGTGNCSP
jgi:hypothetical protein